MFLQKQTISAPDLSAHLLKLNYRRYTLKRNSFIIFFYASLLSGGQPLKEEFAPLGANSFFNRRPHLERTAS